MNLIDTNAYLGHWAARRLRHNTPAALLALMDRAGIESAWVSSASAIMYRNSHAGNEEMWEALQAAPSPRLVPFAVINPAYAGWEKDLLWCAETMGARGLRLYPTYHTYKLTDACCHALIDAAAALNMVVSVPQRVEDYRQRHWLINAPDVDLGEFAALVAAHPNAKFMVTNAAGAGGSDFVTKKDDLPANYWVDLCRPDAVYTNEAQGLIDALGDHRMVFGSGIPFNYPEPAIIRMEALEKQGYNTAAIGAENARKLIV